MSTPFKKLLVPLALATSAIMGVGHAHAQQGIELLGSACTPSPDNPITEPGTNRSYVLDYPCDLQEDEAITFILNLHGGGSNTLYQRAYFPAWEQKEAQRLVMATPHSPAMFWQEGDDEYLQNIVTAVIEAVGADNVTAFWLVGHSQGGLTSRRLVCTEFFQDKVDGFVSLSGGRLGGSAPRSANAGRPTQADAPPPSSDGSAPRPRITIPSGEPECDFSHIYAIGEYEISELPDSSSLAERFNCSARIRHEDVVDTEAGKIYDSRSQNPGTREWGLLPRPGTAQVFQYPDCDDGRIVADIVRMDKGHTEGLEPRIMETIVGLMTSAAGGKISGRSN